MTYTRTATLITAMTTTFITSSALTPYFALADTNKINSGKFAAVQTITDRIDNPDSIIINGAKNKTFTNLATNIPGDTLQIKSGRKAGTGIGVVKAFTSFNGNGMFAVTDSVGGPRVVVDSLGRVGFGTSIDSISSPLTIYTASAGSPKFVQIYKTQKATQSPD